MESIKKDNKSIEINKRKIEEYFEVFKEAILKRKEFSELIIEIKNKIEVPNIEFEEMESLKEAENGDDINHNYSNYMNSLFLNVAWSIKEQEDSKETLEKLTNMSDDYFKMKSFLSQSEINPYAEEVLDQNNSIFNKIEIDYEDCKERFIEKVKIKHSKKQ